jgi:hypothetical protein
MQIKSALVAGMLALGLSACSLMAPNYSPAFQNAEKAKALPSNVTLGSFSAQKPELEEIGIRGNTMKASQGAFSSYLKDAVAAELKMGNKLGVTGDAELSAVILVNELNTGAGGTGDGTLSARFTVLQGKVMAYDKSLTAKTEFPSSFVGAIAIPNAAAAFVPLVQKLIETLFSDADFVKAVKK